MAAVVVVVLGSLEEMAAATITMKNKSNRYLLNIGRKSPFLTFPNFKICIIQNKAHDKKYKVIAMKTKNYFLN